MAKDNPLASIITTKIIEKITAGTFTMNEAKDINTQLLTRYLNVSKDTADRLKRSGQIFDFWKQILQNAHIKGKLENFQKSLNTIIDSAPTSMIAQFTTLYQNTANNQPSQNSISTQHIINDKPLNIQKIHTNVKSSLSQKDALSIKHATETLNHNNTPTRNKTKTTNNRNKDQKLQKN